MRTRTFRIFPLGMVFSALPMLLAAQSTGVTTADLKVRVQDGEGRPLAGAKISLFKEDIREVRDGITGSNGQYRFRLLPAGTYKVQATATGQQSRQRVITLQIGDTDELDLVLAANGVVDERMVLVEETTQGSERTQIATVVGESLIANLPINRRSFSDFSLTTPFAAVGNLPTECLQMK